MLTAPPLATSDRVRHAFFSREGGVSEGIYASLNCGLGSGDDPERVHHNRAQAMVRLQLPPAALATARQVHSARAVIIDRPWREGERPDADGLVTNQPGVALGILTADCAPVLFADAEAGVIGAAHAGWRGAWDGILAATVAAMLKLGARPERIAAVVGPCIRQPSYEVSEAFRRQFVEDEPANAALFVPSSRAEHFRFDLAGYVQRRLQAMALGSIAVLPHDTFADPAQFFSFRRVTLNGGGDYGRMLSAIALVA
ncbi:peptidoglycan editing factor PgeF [Defluviicoccus vanus]|uniref:Purine nucleoside phosphorylase n=1 Tax=Defluviicoccus vanus TaxID=111831 RepID=A0A7H1N4F4_9PROT|nr:peptidoglycan editing factor PgeF [Defluviicoccus vanus]QNT70590.1 peptidoglycan editing factor PgeF [Defluviicoccus vanus]